MTEKWAPLWKKTRTARQRERRRQVTKMKAAEKDEKQHVRKRDRFCRFPRCGCRKLVLGLKVYPEVSHDKHKAMGGNPTGDRSTAAGMIQLCRHRHQDGHFSRHKGTLRVRALTAKGNNGPIAWDIDMAACDRLGRRGLRGINTEAERWRELARETAVQVWAPFNEWQATVLDALAEMEL